MVGFDFRADRQPVIETAGLAGHMKRMLTVRRTLLGADYDLALATDLLVPTALLSRLWILMLLSLPLVLVISAGRGYWISGRALSPVTGMIAEVRSLDSAKLNQRIEVPDTGDEIRLLAETMNLMLARMEEGFARVRQFTANASHELRTPLAMIRATAEVALLAPPSGRAQRDALIKILREAERNSTLLDEMLQLARADAGAEAVSKLPVDPAECLRQACTEVAPLAQEKGIHIAVAASACVIAAESAYLRRLWIILLDNAIRYTPAGGTVTASVVQVGDRVHCTVKDTGIGIAPEHLPRIFERFYRVDKTRGRRDRGTGLGLAVAKQVADLFQAELEVSSELGKGSSFIVMFRPCPASAGTRADREAIFS